MSIFFSLPLRVKLRKSTPDVLVYKILSSNILDGVSVQIVANCNEPYEAWAQTR